MTSNANPGNFANRPHEQVEDIAHKGGQSSHNSGFAHMDESKQVIHPSLHDLLNKLQCNANKIPQRDIASKGGHSSGGSFEPGDPRAREAGHRGGQASGGSFEPGDPRAREAGKKGGLSGQPDD